MGGGLLTTSALECLSLNERTLFVNLFGRANFGEDPVEGMTCAITGPWRRGPL